MKASKGKTIAIRCFLVVAIVWVLSSPLHQRVWRLFSRGKTALTPYINGVPVDRETVFFLPLADRLPIMPAMMSQASTGLTETWVSLAFPKVLNNRLAVEIDTVETSLANPWKDSPCPTAENTELRATDRAAPP